MNIQTYEVEEVNSEAATMAADAEGQELIEKLGLDGQRSLLDVGSCTRFPYRLMTKPEHLVFRLCFPERTELKSYSDGIIPNRVLQVAAFVKDFANSPVKLLKVWHCGSAKEDPLLVGHTDEYGGRFYLLARWGDSLAAFDALEAKAKTIWKSLAHQKLRKKAQEAEEDLANLDSLTASIFANGKANGANNSYDLETL